MEEKILLDIEFNSDEIKAATNNIVNARQNIDKLIEANKQLVAQGQKNSAAYVQNEVQIKKLNAEVSNNSKILQANTQAVQQNANSLDGLKKRNQEIIKERNKLDFTTDEGRKKLKELNDEYDRNAKIIADNSTKVEQQRFNIGNYKSALEGTIPQVSQFSQVSETAGKAVTGFRVALGPVGIAIGVIAAALGLLLKSFFGTQEGMDKLSAVTRVFGAVLDRVTGVLQELGGRVFKQLSEAIDDPIQAFKNLGQAIVDNVIKRFEALAMFGPAIKKIFSGDIADGLKDLGNAVIQVTTGIEDGIDKIQNAASSLSSFVDEAVAQGRRLDQLQKEIERAEIRQIVRGKELELVIKQQKAAVEDVTKSFQEREQAAIRAQQAQNEALNSELSLLDKRIEKMQLQQSLNDTSREDEKELAELQARRLELQARFTEQGIEFSKKLVEIRKAQADQEAAIAKNITDLRLELMDDEEAQTIAKIKAQTEERIAALKGTEEQISEQRILLQELQEQQIQEVRDKYAEEARAKEEERLKAQYEFEKGLLDQALIDYQEYVQGQINIEKEKLLQGLISQQEYDEEIRNLGIAALETELAIKEQFGERDLALQGRLTDARIAQKKFEADETARLEKQKLDAIQSTLGQVANLFNKNSVAFKALASAQTLIQTVQSAQAVFTGMTTTIPGPVGIALGIAGAAAATLAGLQRVNQINSTQVPKLEDGGYIEIGGRRHSQGGEDVVVGGKRVANVEQGENLVVLKRGSTPLLRQLSHINKMVGGRDFYSDQRPRYFNQDGGFVARQASQQVAQFQNINIEDTLKRVKIFTSITELERVQDRANRATFTSELS